MIYEDVDESDPIRQGDIFFQLPFILFEPAKLTILKNNTLMPSDWGKEKKNKYTKISAGVYPTWGIVASQDCDASLASYITFFQINDFFNITGIKSKDKPKKPNGWQKLLTKKSRLCAAWFYLPPDNENRFESKRMAVDFESVFQVPRVFLEEQLTTLRKCRLTDVAYEHYRESGCGTK